MKCDEKKWMIQVIEKMDTSDIERNAKYGNDREEEYLKA